MGQYRKGKSSIAIQPQSREWLRICEVQQMAKRKTITKKLRFEIFKRDNFTCQYCGRMAPDVILEIEHINPVSKGGDNNILNLVTSCQDCNSGKSDRLLSDNQVIKQQQTQLKELNERREQLKLLVQWKKELENLENEQVEIVENILEEATGHGFSDYGKRQIKKDIKKFGINEIIECTKISISQYLVDGKDDSITKVFNYIGRIAACRSKSANYPYFAKYNYVKAIIRNRFGIHDESRFIFLKQYVTEENYETLVDIAKESRNWADFYKQVNLVFEEVD